MYLYMVLIKLLGTYIYTFSRYVLPVSNKSRLVMYTLLQPSNLEKAVHGIHNVSSAPSAMSCLSILFTSSLSRSKLSIVVVTKLS